MPVPVSNQTNIGDRRSRYEKSTSQAPGTNQTSGQPVSSSRFPSSQPQQKSHHHDNRAIKRLGSKPGKGTTTEESLAAMNQGKTGDTATQQEQKQKQAKEMDNRVERRKRL